MDRNFDHIYSLGRNCTCAQQLSKLGLRTFAGPFDWVGTAPLRPRLELILEEFQDFLEESYLEPIPIEPNHGLRCDPYLNKVKGFSHRHDFPAGVPLSQSFPEIKKKYVHRITRFLDTLHSNKKVLLVWYVNIPIKDDPLIPELCRRINEKFECQIHFLFIEGVTNLPPGELDYSEPTELTTLYRFHIESPTSLRQQRKWLNKILSPYSMPGTFRRRAGIHLAQVVANLLSAFIPIKSWRIACRDKVQHWLKVKKF